MGHQKYLETTDFSDVDSVSMNDLGVYFFLEEDYRSAAVCMELLLDKLVKFGDNYSKKLESLGYIYEKLGDEKNLARIIKLIEENNDHVINLPCHDYKCKIEKAQWLALKGDEAGAKQAISEARALCTHDSMIIAVDEGNAQILYELQDFEGAARYFVVAAEKRRTLFGSTSEMAEDYHKGATMFFIAHKLDIAFENLKMAIAYYENDTTEAGRKGYLDCLELMVRYIGYVDSNEKALEWSNIMVNTLSKSDVKKSEMFANALVARAKIYVKMERYDDGAADYHAAIAIYDTLKLDTKLANTYSELSICYTKAGKEEAANAAGVLAESHRRDVHRRLLNEELSNIESTAILSGRIYVNSLYVIGSCYAELDSCEKAADYYERYVTELRKMLREQFIFMGEEGRMRIWNDQISQIDEVKKNMVGALVAENNVCRKRLAGVVYDLELISKGIMLNSAIEFESVLKKSKNRELLALYEKIKQNAVQIEEMRQQGTGADLAALNRLATENNLMEIELMKSCAEYDDYTKYLAYSWHDVQDKLQAEDMAIEFTNYDESPLDENVYLFALVLTKEGTPDAKLVISKKYINIMKSLDDLYDDAKYYPIIWESMAEEMAGKKRIYFAPNTFISDMAIEYMKCGEKPMSEVYEMHRMSSTKELCRTYATNGKKRAALFGNIRYSKNQKKGASSEASETRGALDFGALKNAEQEMKDVAKVLKSGKVKVSSYEWTKADEAHFRALDEAGYDIIHVSTHGAYLGDRNTSASDAMRLSLLAFADINDFQEATDEKNDGILMAADIAQMNLRGCDLAVLSACETARGASGGDGVFGLQRGFKNAGVHSLMMSIKPVYDKATAKLMAYFYTNLANGMDKRNALVSAQRQLREEGFAEGKYWAMFIIIDE